LIENHFDIITVVIKKKLIKIIKLKLKVSGERRKHKEAKKKMALGHSHLPDLLIC